MRATRLLKTIFLPLMMAGALAACGGDKEAATGKSDKPLPKVEAPAGKSWTETVTISKDGGYVLGNPDAPIKLMEYASLTCPHCRDFDLESHDSLRKDFIESGRVSYELRNFLLNPFDVPLSLLTRCGAPETYFPLTHQFYQNQAPFLEGLQKMPPATLEAAAKLPEDQRFYEVAKVTGMIDFFSARGISADQAQACLTDAGKRKALIAMTEQGANELKVQGTPSIFINGEKLDSIGWPALKTRLQEMGAR